MPTYMVQWEKPDNGQVYDLAGVLERVASGREGRWARIAECPSYKAAASLASRLRHGRYDLPDGQWDFRHKGRLVYARCRRRVG